MAEYRVEFKKSARKEFDGLPAQVQDKVVEAVFFLAKSPFSDLLHIKKFKAAGRLYRIRLGDYRVIYEVLQDSSMIVIVKIGHRSDVYRHL